MLRALVLSAALALSACGGSSPSISPHIAAPINISSGGLNEQIAASDIRYTKFVAWLDENKNGWSQTYATNPNGGIIVVADDMWFQFVGNAVFVLTKDGMLTKSIRESDYAFLRSAAGT